MSILKVLLLVWLFSSVNAVDEVSSCENACDAYSISLPYYNLHSDPVESLSVVILIDMRNPGITYDISITARLLSPFRVNSAVVFLNGDVHNRVDMSVESIEGLECSDNGMGGVCQQTITAEGLELPDCSVDNQYQVGFVTGCDATGCAAIPQLTGSASFVFPAAYCPEPTQGPPSCYCDLVCFTMGDCCQDVCAVCGYCGDVLGDLPDFSDMLYSYDYWEEKSTDTEGENGASSINGEDGSVDSTSNEANGGDIGSAVGEDSMAGSQEDSGDEEPDTELPTDVMIYAPYSMEIYAPGTEMTIIWGYLGDPETLLDVTLVQGGDDIGNNAVVLQMLGMGVEAQLTILQVVLSDDLPIGDSYRVQMAGVDIPSLVALSETFTIQEDLGTTQPTHFYDGMVNDNKNSGTTRKENMRLMLFWGLIEILFLYLVIMAV
mmetsp:Transcript_17459/g.22414  ORF Transcript_17459/g.22414 Transcript_17459/m.22414 type:complete len:434 (+) Transcript_17459:340-1641(+)